MVEIWLAVEKDGSEFIFDEPPERFDEFWDPVCRDTEFIELPKGSIKKILGFELKWEDEPVRFEGYDDISGKPIISTNR